MNFHKMEKIAGKVAVDLFAAHGSFMVWHISGGLGYTKSS